MEILARIEGKHCWRTLDLLRSSGPTAGSPGPLLLRPFQQLSFACQPAQTAFRIWCRKRNEPRIGKKNVEKTVKLVAELLLEK